MGGHLCTNSVAFQHEQLDKGVELNMRLDERQFLEDSICVELLPLEAVAFVNESSCP